jgi:hypothetical protein
MREIVKKKNYERDGELGEIEKIVKEEDSSPHLLS